MTRGRLVPRPLPRFYLAAVGGGLGTRLEKGNTLVPPLEETLEPPPSFQ